MKKIYTLTIGVPAYNEESNIGFLLKDLLKQKTKDFVIKKIIVVSDGSTDNTVKIVKSFKSNRIVVLDDKNRKGKSQRENQIISLTHTDILIIFDADISISDNLFIKKLIDPIIRGVGDMTSAAICELPPSNFIEKTLFISMKLKSILFSQFRYGNNVYNCHGPAIAFSKNVYSKLRYVFNKGDDMYAYLSCVRLGYKFIFVPKAKLSYRLPSTLNDHYKQSSRYLNSISSCKKVFGDKFVRNEFQIPAYDFVKATFRSLPFLFENLLYVFSYLFVLALVNVLSVLGIKSKESWGVRSTKKAIKI